MLILCFQVSVFEDVRYDVFFNYYSLFLEIIFNTDIILLIKIIQSNAIHTINLKFFVWHRPFGQSDSNLLGIAYVKFSDVCEAPDYTLVQNVPVLSKDGTIAIGSLHFEISLGCRGLHFGVDFLDAITSCKENIFDPFPEHSQAISGSSSNRSQPELQQKKSEQQKYCRVPKMGKQVVSPASSSNDKQSQNQSVATVSVAQQTDTSSQSAADGGKRKPYDNPNNDDKHIQTMKPLSEPNETNILHGLLHIESISHNAPGFALDNTGNFIVCRSFWRKDVTTTNMCKNNIFNYFEVPVINFFFFRSKL